MYIPGQDELDEDGLPYTKITNRETLDNPNDEGSKVLEAIRAKQSQSARVGNIGQAMDAFSRGVNTPQANTQLYKNMQEQGENEIKLVQNDISNQAKVKQMIANREQQAKQHGENMALKRDQIKSNEGLRMATLGFQRDKMDAKNNKVKTVDSLNSTEKQRYDNIVDANNMIKSMGEALQSGQSRYSLVGDNDYTAALTRFEDALGRMQSGGAIGKEEEKRFKSMARSLGDSPEMQAKKLESLKTMMADRVRTLGLNPDEDKRFQYSISKPKSGGIIDDAVAAPPKKAIKDMTDEELAAEAGI